MSNKTLQIFDFWMSSHIFVPDKPELILIIIKRWFFGRNLFILIGSGWHRKTAAEETDDTIIKMHNIYTKNTARIAKLPYPNCNVRWVGQLWFALVGRLEIQQYNNRKLWNCEIYSHVVGIELLGQLKIQMQDSTVAQQADDNMGLRTIICNQRNHLKKQTNMHNLDIITWTLFDSRVS